MTSIHILVAEDDDNIRMGLVDILESESFRVTQAADGDAALARFREAPVDLVLLDIMMPGKNGFDVCRDIRAMDQQVPIIMLTAKGEEMDKVIGLHSGADDYITKPFGIHELLARITAVLRRSTRPREPGEQNGRDEKNQAPDGPGKTIFPFGDFDVNPATYTMVPRKRPARTGSLPWQKKSPSPQVKGSALEEIPLTQRELHLLWFFYRHPGQVLSRDTLLNEIWGISYGGTTRTLDQHIAKLRKKIEKKPAAPALITTVHGVGYRYAPPC